MKKRWIVVLAALLLFILILVCLLVGRPMYIDQAIPNFIAGLRTEWLTAIMDKITILGEKYFIVALVLVIACIYYFKKNKYNAIMMCVNLFNIVVLNKGIKYVVRRERPINMLIEEDGFSFPSGHTMLSIGVYGLLIYFIYKSNIKSSVKKLLITILTLIILIVGLSRLYLGVHYPTDVIGGYLITLAYLIVYVTVMVKIEKRLKK